LNMLSKRSEEYLNYEMHYLGKWFMKCGNDIYTEKNQK